MAAWTNGTGGDVASTDFIAAVDFTEIQAALVRRRKLKYLVNELSWPSTTGSDYVKHVHLTDATIGLRDATQYVITNFGWLSGTPPTPYECVWLMPSGPNEGKRIVIGTPGANDVNFFQEMNGTGNWTDPTLSGGAFVKDVHMNELRWGIETLSRGYWRFPVYLAAGIFSLLPDEPWLTEAIGNNQGQELRSLGFFKMHYNNLGLEDVVVRNSSKFWVTNEGDYDCSVEVYRCKRPLEWLGYLPSWNEYQLGGTWQVAGCGGDDDRALMGSMTVSANSTNYITGSSVAAAYQAMIDDGAEQHFMIRRSDAGNQTIWIKAAALITFDLDIPPN